MAVAERVADIKQILESKLRQAPTKYEIGQNCGADDESRHAPPTKSKVRELGCDLVEMIRPTLERAPHFVGVFGAIVNASYTTFMPALVIEHCLDYVWLHTNLGHVGRSTSPTIMKSPRRNAQASIKSHLVLIPTLITIRIAKQER
jgi:hypothetical protein